MLDAEAPEPGPGARIRGMWKRLYGLQEQERREKLRLRSVVALNTTLERKDCGMVVV